MAAFQGKKWAAVLLAMVLVFSMSMGVYAESSNQSVEVKVNVEAGTEGVVLNSSSDTKVNAGDDDEEGREDDDKGEDEEKDNHGKVKVWFKHKGADAGAVMIKIDGKVVVDKLSYEETSVELELEKGERLLEVIGADKENKGTVLMKKMIYISNKQNVEAVVMAIGSELKLDLKSEVISAMESDDDEDEDEEGKENDDDKEQEDKDKDKEHNGKWDKAAKLRLVHHVEGAPAVKIYLNGKLLVDGLKYGDISKTLDVEAGTHEIKIVAADGKMKGEVLLKKSFDCVDHEEVTATIKKLMSGLDLEWKKGLKADAEVDADLDDKEEQEKEAVAKAWLRLMHDVKGAPTVMIKIDGKLWVKGLAYGELSEELELEEGEHDIVIFTIDANGKDQVLLEKKIDLKNTADKKEMTAVIKGVQDGIDVELEAKTDTVVEQDDEQTPPSSNTGNTSNNNNSGNTWTETEQPRVMEQSNYGVRNASSEGVIMPTAMPQTGMGGTADAVASEQSASIGLWKVLISLLAVAGASLYVYRLRAQKHEA
ncbi:DUF4397 domain-containing protein [Marinicrinis sediminis]|uniref:DUF4397 domain-containing protein n=1 Tax=Marinicrinis sediminis TaxID=1652465 RepID=A0ABW5R9F0_9BACL